MIVVLAALVACHTDAPDPDAPTYYADVRPILDAHCARCHTANGVAPVSFDDVATVVAMGPAIAAQTAAGTMPPPAPDPTCRDYEGSDAMTLDDSERAVLAAWADADMPLGEPADAPPPAEVPTLAPFDVELRGATPFAPTFSDTSAPGNEYRCFAFDFDSDTDRFATGFEALIDQTAIVHHVVLFHDTTDTTDVNDADGFPCSGLGEDGWDTVAAWGPGSLPVRLPDGAGVRIEAHERLVLQMHYFDSGADVAPDATGYGLLLADQVDTEVAYFPVGAYNFDIPAGDPSYTVTASDRWPMGEGQFDILAAWPHMHVHGKALDFTVTHTNGDEECVLRMNDWNFHDQASALLLEPVHVSAGDKLTLNCTYDNSDGTEPVSFGEGTQDEMCFAFLYAGF